ncbi:hypothetical protein IW261DRAFT_1559683 [Armillaria novae-zelandiae]|uniref:Uncharacterized protein n=1 Tax=Armillaria novae-zelandiae TaxID=153914 RepID=A0AA39PN95_9AGAR|nr:hypothetical protein IW261DRAFT_1559683 [Armillaria novae-zelandiae]
MTETVPFNSGIDDPPCLLPDLPSRSLGLMTSHDFPLYSGANLDEGAVYPRLSQIRSYIAVNFSPPAIINRVLDLFLQFYPGDPVLGSPYGTGNQNLGLQETEYPAQTGHAGGCESVWISVYATPVSNSSYIAIIFRILSGMLHETVSSNVLSEMMIDYWVSFSTSLDPNDDLGLSTSLAAVYT